MQKKSIGIISLILSAISWLIFWWLSIAGIILGIVAVAGNNTNKTETSGVDVCAILGIVIGAIGLIIMLLV